jgi:hypothetical protein
MSWIERATANLLRFSTDREPGEDSFAEVMREWEMTSGYNDLEEPTGTCELCEHQEIRHQYEVQNRFTKIALWVGSKCIEKFVPLYENDVEVTNPEEKARLLTRITTKLIDEARRQRAERLIDDLSKIDDRFAGSSWVRDWKKGYSVKQLQMMAFAATHAGLKFNAADFQINTRRGRVVDQAKDLQRWQYQQLRPAFPPARQKEFDEYYGLA